MADGWASNWGSSGGSSWGTNWGTPGGGSRFTSYVGGGAAGPSNSRLFPDFLGDLVPHEVKVVGSNFVHGAAETALQTIPAIYDLARYAVHDVRAHPASLLTGPAAPITAQAISIGEGHGGGQLTKRLAEPIAQAYADKYGRVLHGDFSGIERDPFGTALDIFALAAIPFSAGGSAAVRGLGLARLAEFGQAMRAGRALSYVDEAGNTRFARAGGMGEKLRVGATSQPIRRAAQVGYDRLSQALPAEVKVGERSLTVPFSAESRVARAERAWEQAAQRKLETARVPFDRSLSKLSHAELLAVPLRATGVNREAYLAFLRDNIEQWQAHNVEQHATLQAELEGASPAAAAKIQRAIKNLPPEDAEPITSAAKRLINALEQHGEEIDKLLAEPTDALNVAAEHGKALAQLQQQIYVKAGRFSDQAAELRIERPGRVVAGSRRLDEQAKQSEEYQLVAKDLRKARRKVSKLQRKLETTDDPDLVQEKLDTAESQLGDAIDRANEAGYETVDSGHLTGWSEADQAKLAEIQRGVAGDQFYLPHTGPGGATSGFGRDAVNLLEPQRIPAELRRSDMLRWSFGDLPWNPASLSHSYTRAAHWDFARRTREWAASYGEPLSLEEYGHANPGVRKGWTLMRHPVGPGEQAGTAAGSVPRSVREHLAMHDEIKRLEGGILDTKDHKTAINQLIGDTFPLVKEGTDIQKMINEGYVQVPDRIARMAKHELTQSTNSLLHFYDRALDVWRTAVLYLRPAWLINNIFGQHLLYLIHHLGPVGMSQYLRAVAVNTKGQDAILDNAALRTLVSGGPSRGIGGHAGEGSAILPFGKGLSKKQVAVRLPLIPAKAVSKPLRWANYRIADDQTRIANFLAHAKFRQYHAYLNGWDGILGKVKKALHDYTPLPGKALGQNVSELDTIRSIPESLAEEILSDTNKMLGDYREMSPLERRYAVRFIPFWGWYRTIGAISLRLPIENPIRLAFIHNMELLSREQGSGVHFPVPSWLQGSLDLGKGPGGTERLVATTGLNPFQTDVQVATAAGAALSGDPRFGGQGPLSVLSPAFAIGAQSYGLDPFYGGKYQGPLASEGVPGRFAASLVTGLPEYRLTQQTLGVGGYQSTLYRQSPWDYILNYLGLPFKNTYLPEAQRRAASGQ